MTPRNPLDDKVIIDRVLAKAVLDILDASCASFSEYERTELRKALAADLTGWVAVPHVLTGGMFNASRVDLPETVMLPVGLVAQCKWASILDASPPLPGVGSI